MGEREPGRSSETVVASGSLVNSTVDLLIPGRESLEWE